MSTRAPKPEPAPEDAHHLVLGHWTSTKWWRATNPVTGKILAETSTPDTDTAFQSAVALGADVQCRYDFVPAECRWHDQEN